MMSVTYNEAVEMLAKKKDWAAASFDWKSKDKNRLPPSFECRFVLRAQSAIIEDLFLMLRHKASSIPGVPDCFNAAMFYRQQRILALDVNGSRRHRNRVGRGKEYFGQSIGHPHIHLPVPESLDGYAEPVDTKDIQGQWETFLRVGGIVGAPALELPATGQLGLF